MGSSDLDRSTVETAYARWAPIYDAVCGPVMVNGRRAAARAARETGGRILEVGVGTGLSFDDYDLPLRQRRAADGRASDELH
jgi:phosphatidylethanolamine/phosphatidyl-N-methylethanolamine N-methyltransferase